ncbi:MAG: protein phosphatase 2C domain-containing protein [Prevotella sp.]|nr:protein phosphatase 2C domain-containing protein [Prevotella sp.]
MKFSISASCRIGCVRRKNEDMVLVGEHLLRDDSFLDQFDAGDGDRYMLALADGMGGHTLGDVASSEVLHNLQFFFYDLPIGLSSDRFIETMREWLSSINITINSMNKGAGKRSKMGTTLVVLACYGGNCYWLNCGDSRVYRMTDGVLSQLSTDHSLNTIVGEKEHSSIITNCIGGGCKNSYFDISMLSEGMQSGDTYLLCSDGLTDMLSNDEIADFLLRGYDADALCIEAEKAGGFDNVSVIIVHVS